MSSEADSSFDLGDVLAGVGSGPSLPAHFYVHVPFCRSKCSYCDFASIADASPDVVASVFAGLRSEITRWGAARFPGVIETVYVGGGTPSLHAEEVAALLVHLHRTLPVRAGAEVTVEANPDSLTASSLDALVKAGTARMSVGVQSFDEETLRRLGRCHDVRQAEDAARLVVSAGLDLSIDLICGVDVSPKGDAWRATLERAVRLGPSHVSVYPLQVEEDTPLAWMVASGALQLPDEDQVADELLFAEEYLGSHGIERYEVANYAVVGHESRHNSAYWQGRMYAGIGPSAHGMLDVPTARAVGLFADTDAERARVRYAECSNVGQWLTGGDTSVEVLTRAEAAREDVMLGLRLVRGVSASIVERAALSETLASLADDGLVELVRDGGMSRWRTTARGWLLGNEVFGRVWSADSDS